MGSTNEHFQRGSNLRNEEFSGELRAALGNEFVIGFGFQPQLGNSLLFFAKKLKMPAQLVTQVRKGRSNDGLEDTAMGFPERFVDQLLRQYAGPTLMEIPPGIRVAQRGQERELGKRPIERV